MSKTFTVERRVSWWGWLEPVQIEADNFERALHIAIIQLRRDYPLSEFREVQLVDLPFYYGDGYFGDSPAAFGRSSRVFYEQEPPQ